MSGEPTALVGPNAPNWEQRLVSRLSMTNRADSQNSGYSLSSRQSLKREQSLCSSLNSHRADNQNGRSQLSIPESRKRPLTDCDGISLRKEVRDLSQLGDRPVSWNMATDRWRNYIRDKEDVQNVFENCAGDRIQGSKPHRFHEEYADKQYAKLKDLERGISEAYGKRLHTAMLTFTASSTDDSDNPLPPVDHLEACSNRGTLSGVLSTGLSTRIVTNVLLSSNPTKAATSTSTWLFS